ncbi:LysR family transcriptional regulator [Pseudomonas sediminis]|uniref:LysR family transcriptional regulator n=1 Tax=Pseudomonas sediminis TaxID=1691904 RepID=A0ABX6SF35_9PSED|nr:LysR family transcriptional regulator [Pseudomonas sediminis]QNH00016.1 LysR family transcriptional regulator [Pseudomonas sediminis]
MELRQLRYFLKVVEHGSLGRAALELNVGTSALSQQISKLENELSVRLLTRSSTGVSPTPAGIAFQHHAQLTLRQAENAAQAAQRERMSGYVSLGFAPSTSSVLALPLIAVMRQRYPNIQLHLVEMLSGYLTSQLHARQLDLAILFHSDPGRRFRVRPLLDEKLFLISSTDQQGIPTGPSVTLDQLTHIPLVLPSGQHGLRSTINNAFAHSRCEPTVVMNVDGLALLMETVKAGYAATIQPGAVAAKAREQGLRVMQIADAHAGRRNLLVSLPDDELSPAALAARVAILDTTRELVASARWPGAQLLDEHDI